MPRLLPPVAARLDGVRSSRARDVLELIQHDEVMSFAGGLRELIGG